MEFSDSRLWESYRRMCDREEGDCHASSEPFWISASRGADKAWAAGPVLEESAGEEDVLAEGVDAGALPPCADSSKPSQGSPPPTLAPGLRGPRTAHRLKGSDLPFTKPIMNVSFANRSLASSRWTLTTP
ncbi:hypothetical protein EYF80_010251 [Liparis tanakae]|uniref:Uncharacterized protein n=1 Tax=Liparis tanakae TaxID=230148 RepID=A0A4Z2INS4_9TELE|nr:hypothetical protein EYF80_010251 [Liparis tanakae]